MAQAKSSFTLGVILIAIGVLFLLEKYSYFDMEVLWPLIFLVLAGMMLSLYFANRQKNAEALIPFGIFLVFWIVFETCAVAGWDLMAYLWPGFIFAPGFGLFLVYLQKRDTRVLIPVGVLIGMSAVFFVTMSPFGRYWPAMLILAGLLLILLPHKSHDSPA